MCRIALTLLLALSSLAFAPAPLPKAERRGGAGGIEGLWQRQGGGDRVLISPTRVAFLTGSRAEYELRLDRSARPAACDLRGVKGNYAEGSEFPGSYKVEGDALTICYRAGAGPRPTAFDPKGGHLDVYKRVR